VASYSENNILMSGWLLGEDYIARKAAGRVAGKLETARLWRS
jgi:hypothetical protein